MRKEADFEVMDMITIYAKGNAKVEEILTNNKNVILSEVMATDVVTGTTDGVEKNWNINGEEVVLAVKKN